ncbi:reticulocyte binding protein, putative [Plasmodium berghei]|uniref:Reticulocyte binding protein, putative n=1 Tax=Plasmodium berghei TaxID=5821 RepID=A0A0Y9PYN5_PLABE|nr:reticulocyte binding protein, putative [Plasmodium berghei]
MKKYIYIISLAAFYIFSDIICGTQIKKNKNKHAPKSNNYNPYHNLKESDFNNSNFSNEKQYNNKNNFINNEKYIQPYLINNNTFQNKKDINNTKLTLYNEYNKTNNLDDFRNFNHEHEKTNNRLIEINKSFLQITYISRINKNTLNTVDTIYGVNDDESVLSFFYKPLYSAKYIKKMLEKLNILSNYTVQSKLNNNHDTVLNDVIETNKSCNDKKQELINRLSNIHNSFYNAYNDPSKDDYNLYTLSKTNFVNCLKNGFEKIKNKPNDIISYEEDVYKNNCKNSSKINSHPQNNSEFCKTVTRLGSNYKRNWEVPKDNEVIPFIDFLINELKQNNNLKTLVPKLEFIKKQFEDIKNKHDKYIKMCKEKEVFVKKCTNTTIDNNNCDKYFNEIKKIAESYSILDYNYRILDYLESIRITYKYSLIHFFKSLGGLLINKVDSDGNIIEKDGIYDFDLITPKNKLSSLETELNKIFENKWNDYKSKKDLEKFNDTIKNIILSIISLMDEFKGLNTSMINLRNDGVTNKFNITSQIKNKLNVYTYEERKKGFQDSLILANNWETEKTKILTELKKKNEETIQLEIKIKELIKQITDIVEEQKIVNELKLELSDKIKDIIGKIEYVKKAVELKKEIEKNNAYIDELAKKSPYQITEYIEKKNTMYNTIKAYFDQIYEGDIDTFYNKLSSIVKESPIDNTENKTKLEDLKSKIDNVYNKIENMKIETVKSHLNNIETSNKLSETILEIKKYIYEEIIKELNKTSEDFKNKEQELSNKINDYDKKRDQFNSFCLFISTKHIYNLFHVFFFLQFLSPSK